MRQNTLIAIGVAGALAGSLTACGESSAGSGDGSTVTVYSADGLRGENGDGWYDRVFEDFEKETGIKVEYVEGGSGEMVQRAAREKSNTQADVLVTLPPFIQQADSLGLIEPYKPAGFDKIADGSKAADGTWTSIVDNYFGFIYNTAELDEAPRTWDDLLDGRFRGKLQYSTPGVAGDGTAMVIKAMHDMGGQEAAMEYFGKLQESNVGPSSSTSKLAPKVDKGELLVANGDVQMNMAQSKNMPNLGIWFAAEGSETPTTFAIPYAAGLVEGAPQRKNGRKLLDYLLGEQPQQQVSEIGGGFSPRTDIEAADANAKALAKTMDGVDVFQPDWDDISQNLDSYVDAWKSATGS